MRHTESQTVVRNPTFKIITENLSGFQNNDRIIFPLFMSTRPYSVTIVLLYHLIPTMPSFRPLTSNIFMPNFNCLFSCISSLTQYRFEKCKGLSSVVLDHLKIS